MCTPMLGMMLNFAGAMSQAAGQRHAAEAKAAEYRYQAQVDDNNRKVAEWKAADAKVEGASQRIQEDAMNFAKIVESLGLQVVRAIMLLIAFIPILWGL